jgi:hypothetical protein
MIAIGAIAGRHEVLLLGGTSAVLAGYLAASAVIEPVWAEVEQRFGQHHLRGGLWELVATRIVVAAVFLAVALSLGIGVVVLAVPGIDPLVIVLGPVLGPSLALAAAVPPTGEPPDPSLRLLGDFGVTMMLIVLFQGPLLALLLATPPLMWVLGAPAPSSLLLSAVWTAITSQLMVVWLRRRAGKIA